MIQFSGGYDLGQGCGLDSLEEREAIGLGLGNKNVLYISEDMDQSWAAVGVWEAQEVGWVYYPFDTRDASPP